MNPKNPQSKTPWVEAELRALRAEEPTEMAIERAVYAMQAEPAPPPTRRLAWRPVAVVGAIAVVGGFLVLRSPDAQAGELRRIADAMRKQQTRHTIDLRPDENGNLVQANEYWVEGEKHRAIFNDADGRKTYSGYNGSRSYVYRTGEGGHIDDTGGMGFPVETIEDYLAIPSASIQGVERGVPEGAIKADVFTVGYGGVTMDLFIEPKSGLPVRRVVRAKSGLIEENHYDYPADIADDQFDVPSEFRGRLSDYPALRGELAKRIAEPGDSQELAGTKITLHAVIVGSKRVIALWSGGARSDFVQDGGIHLVGQAPGHAPGLGISSVFDRPNPDKPAPTRKGAPLMGDGIWYAGPLPDSGTVSIDIPVWEEDRTRPLISHEGKRLEGFHSKLKGHLRFKVDRPIYAQDPDRLLWRPESGASVATSG